MTEVVADHSDVDTCLEQSNGAAVAKNVRRDRPVAQCFHFPSGQLGVLSKQVSDTISSEGPAASIEKRDLAGLRVSADLPQRLGRVSPQRAETLLVPLAVDSDLVGTVELQVGRANGKSLADPSAGVVEEEEEGAVSTSEVSRRVGLSQENADLFRLEVVNDWLPGLLAGETEDPLVLSRSSRIMSEEMLRKPANGNEARVSCGSTVSPARFQVVEKREHVLRAKIIKAEPGDRTVAALGEEAEEETQRIAVREHRMAAGSSNPPKMLVEIGLNECQQATAGRLMSRHRSSQIELQIDGLRSRGAQAWQ